MVNEAMEQQVPTSSTLHVRVSILNIANPPRMLVKTGTVGVVLPINLMY